MSKLLWVALPLLVAAALVALSFLLRRPPTRLALNVGSSLLLLGYLLTTAGLGIFWVANQQLPVFDWHYLFGYGTVLLVSLHLTFNLPVVWRFFRRPRPARMATAAPAGTRRPVLVAAGLALAAVPAFLLGLRHGRSELRIELAPAAGTAPQAPGMALVERFHAFSGHSRAGVLLRAPGTEWDAAPPRFKAYEGAVRLPVAATTAERGATLAALGSALWHTTGITDRRSGLDLRASPSSGALFSTELYLAGRGVAGLPPGLWHFDPRTPAFEQVGPAGEALLASAGALAPGALAVVVATAVFRRTGRKYRDRTYRYVLADLGHALENLRVAAGELGLQAVLLPAFDETLVARALALDQAEEGVLAVAALRPAGAGTAPWAGGVAGPDRWSAAEAALADGSPSELTVAIHRGTSLRRMESAVAPPAGTVVPLPPASPAATGLLAGIARRRSIRRFATSPLPLAALAGTLARMAEAPRLLSSAVRIHLVANAVAGLPPGAYQWRDSDRSLLPRRLGDLRAAAQAAALDQEVIGEAAVVFVLAIDRATLAADPLGAARAYRHAFLEAGLLGERIYLEAEVRGLGACGVGAFYDDEAAALVGIAPAREWVVHFAALGPRTE